mmetsp:Transcript_46959/g.144641  ORF Transcript_46959/g.144641 Transcript_46959/m.144641 type:complete len:126 (-) Transcript_46959:393-770(-)
MLAEPGSRYSSWSPTFQNHGSSERQLRLVASKTKTIQGHSEGPGTMPIRPSIRFNEREPSQRADSPEESTPTARTVLKSRRRLKRKRQDSVDRQPTAHNHVASVAKWLADRDTVTGIARLNPKLP